MSRSRNRSLRLTGDCAGIKFDNCRIIERLAVDQQSAIAALGALAQETRLALFRLLVARGPDGMAAGAIAEQLSVPPSSLSFHLQELAHAGLITQRRSSRHLNYSAEYAAMNELLLYLTENCCGSGQACAPLCDPETALAEERQHGCC